MYILKPIPAGQGTGYAAPSTPQIPTIDRLTVATLPVQAPPFSICIVTDGSATPSQTGIPPVGSGSLENVVCFIAGGWLVI
jgi:hypothetical protein